MFEFWKSFGSTPDATAASATATPPVNHFEFLMSMVDTLRFATTFRDIFPDELIALKTPEDFDKLSRDAHGRILELISDLTSSAYLIRIINQHSGGKIKTVYELAKTLEKEDGYKDIILIIAQWARGEHGENVFGDFGTYFGNIMDASKSLTDKVLPPPAAKPEGSNPTEGNQSPVGENKLPAEIQMLIKPWLDKFMNPNPTMRMELRQYQELFTAAVSLFRKLAALGNEDAVKKAMPVLFKHLVEKNVIGEADLKTLAEKIIAPSQDIKDGKMDGTAFAKKSGEVLLAFLRNINIPELTEAIKTLEL